jgi:hypothetical protein
VSSSCVVPAFLTSATQGDSLLSPEDEEDYDNYTSKGGGPSKATGRTSGGGGSGVLEGEARHLRVLRQHVAHHSFFRQHDAVQSLPPLD